MHPVRLFQQLNVLSFKTSGSSGLLILVVPTDPIDLFLSSRNKEIVEKALSKYTTHLFSVLRMLHSCNTAEEVGERFDCFSRLAMESAQDVYSQLRV